MIFKVIQIIVALLLVGAILLQSRGVGLSSVFGGEGSSYHTKRGFEKFIFITTIILAITFAALSLALTLLD